MRSEIAFHKVCCTTPINNASSSSIGIDNCQGDVRRDLEIKTLIYHYFV